MNEKTKMDWDRQSGDIPADKRERNLTDIGLAAAGLSHDGLNDMMLAAGYLGLINPQALDTQNLEGERSRDAFVNSGFDGVSPSRVWLWLLLAGVLTCL